jgi:NAD+ kinase
VKLALVFNPEKAKTLCVVSRLAALVRGGEHTVLVWGPAAAVARRRSDYAGELDGLPTLDDVRQGDVVVTLGGDGTLLQAVRLLQGAERPLLGINLGSLGFLTDTPENEAEAAVSQLLQGRYRLENRMLLQAHVEPHEGAPRRLTGLNDAVVHAPSARVLDVSIAVAGAELGRSLADGVIVATPSGSTAYSLSAGGPVVSPRLHALAVTPISPHMLAMRPLVVSEDEAIEIRIHRTAGGRAILSVDGQTSLELGEGERVVVQRAPRDLALVVTRDRTFYDTLRTKLGWGQRARDSS